MLLDPAETDWRNVDASELLYAARDGVAQARAELRRRDAMDQAVGTEAARQIAARRAMKRLRKN